MSSVIISAREISKPKIARIIIIARLVLLRIICFGGHPARSSSGPAEKVIAGALVAARGGSRHCIGVWRGEVMAALMVRLSRSWGAANRGAGKNNIGVCMKPFMQIGNKSTAKEEVTYARIDKYVSSSVAGMRLLD